jgi:hypothetical protein
MANLPSPVPVTASNLPNWIRTAAIVINYTLRSVSTLVRRPSKVVTANYVMTNDDFAIGVDATAGNVTVTLPTTDDGKQFIIKKIDASVHTVTVSGAINGSSGVVISTQWAGVLLFGANGGYYAA